MSLISIRYCYNWYHLLLLKKRVKSPGISMHTHLLDAVEVEYVGKIILSHTVLKESSEER